MVKPSTISVCADDYAMTPGVSRGILDALQAGAVTATSVMTTSPWWPEAAAALIPHKTRADIGLHLNLTLGAPLGPMPRLAPDHRFPALPDLMRMARRKALPIAELTEEIDRQCDRFVSVFGRPPDHVDGHQHVHVLRALRPLVFASLKRRGWQPWLRDCADSLPRIVCRAGRKKAVALSVLSDGFAREAADRGFATNEGFAGFSSFDPNCPQARAFQSYVKAAGSRHLVMCHPGYVDDELRKLDPVVETRELELRYIVSDFLTFLDKRKITLKRMSEVCRADTVRE